MTDYDKNYLWLFIGAEVLTFLFSRLVNILLSLIPVSKNTKIAEGLAILKGLITPALLILVALVIMGIYKNNRDGGGTI